MSDIKLHRDGSITVWDIRDQSWWRAPAGQVAEADGLMATLSADERARIERAAKRTKERNLV